MLMTLTNNNHTTLTTKIKDKDKEIDYINAQIALHGGEYIKTTKTAVIYEVYADLLNK